MIDRDELRAEIARVAMRHVLTDPEFVHDNLDPDYCACHPRNTFDDGPTCAHCGNATRRMGSCATCTTCGETTGCG